MDELLARLSSIRVHAERAMKARRDGLSDEAAEVRAHLAEIASDLRVALEYAEKPK